MDIYAGLPPYVRYRQTRSGPNSSQGSRVAPRAGKIKKGRAAAVSLPVLQDLPAASLAAWGYVYQIGTETVARGANLTFSNNGPLNGINHNIDSATIEVTQAGTYNITFSVYTTQNNPQDWAVVINGTVRSEFNSAGQTITGTTSLTLNAADRVTIRNVNTLPDPATLRIGNFTTAYVLIYKVD